MTAGIDYIDRIMNECYLIDKGVRSAYTECIVLIERNESDKEDNANYLKEVVDTVKRNNLICYLTEYERDPDDYPDKRYFNLWVVKYPHQLKLVKKLPYIKNDYIREYLKGKILGYSDSSMEEFLSRNYPKG